jgi:hypothetical protein
MTPEDRAQIPEGIKQPSATWTDPVTGVQQVGFGIKDCRIPFGDNTFIHASLNESAITIRDDAHGLIEGISDGQLLMRAPCGLLSGIDSFEADEELLRQD